MSGERRTRWTMIAVGLVGWVVAIAFLQTWGIIASAVLVAWASYGLLDRRPGVRLSRDDG